MNSGNFCHAILWPRRVSSLLLWSPASTQLLLITQPGLPPQGWSVPLLLKHLPWLPIAFDNEQAWYSEPTFMKSVHLAAFPAPSFPSSLSPPVPSSHLNFKPSGCLAVPLVFLGGGVPGPTRAAALARQVPHTYPSPR